MNKMFDSVDLSNMSNEEIILAINELENEKTRRERERVSQSARNLRNALREFLDCEAEQDFSMVMGLSGCELLDIEVDNDCDWCKEDINYVEFDPFDTEILREIMNELSRCLGKLGE